MTVAEENEIPQWLVRGKIWHGWCLSQQGNVQEGTALILDGIERYQNMGASLYLPYFLSLLAEAYEAGGKIEQGIETLNQALDLVEKADDRFYVAELYRLKGEFLLQRDDPRGAETSLLQSLETTRSQSAKSLELRTAMSLGKLWTSQGKKKKAYALLEETYSWFTEGFDTHDLKLAKALWASGSKGLVLTGQFKRQG